ncbi:DUF221 domain-containing protein [Cordyceps fumosorosea ARSEF 2679]|uniref:DUF221 domain-containing protein n=1 Tax=Cordyceps fumosorosea (strain ARSEF 2679) TaxID=1081104 RepID=A0A167N6M9_CORFA|nr:DUF221 domain-containing protein [Cordyceps fumosorosea ARSEF 2679]OAA55193.1 DUF221 domain-containing protein [Cordyceps fumosorosea ARSEF 2679]
MDDPEHWPWLVARLDLNQNTDPRINSTRNDSSGQGTLSATANSKSPSLSKLGGTFIPIGIILGVTAILFFFLRPRLKRVYAPRTIHAIRRPLEPSPELPSGIFNWVVPFFKTPDTFILNNATIDGFFFIRYLKVLRNICFVGCLLAYPILFPINATGGNHNYQLAALTIGNVKDPNKLYAHLFVAWAFFGFVLFTIVRECIYYVNLRQAYLSSPHYAQRISSKTMLITGLPEYYQDEARLRKLYGDSAKRIYLPRSSKVLAKLVKEREQTAKRLEDAEVKLIKLANHARNNYLKKHPDHPVNEPPPGRAEEQCEVDVESASSERQLASASSASPTLTRFSSDKLQVDLPGPTLLSDQSIEHLPQRNSDETKVDDTEKKEERVRTEEDLDYVHPYGLHDTLPDLRGSVASLWIPTSKRPHHRPIGNFLRRVDTIRWTRNRLRELNLLIFKTRRVVRRGEAGAVSAAFIEFDSQESAQAAQQVLAHHRPLQMSVRLLGIRPDEVIWSSLRMKWWELIMRRTAILALVLAAIVFWSIPAAFVGLVSNVDSLIKLVPFLSWINKLPKLITGFIQGFLPALALSLLMAAVPFMLRFCGRVSGLPSTIRVELFVQNAYFAFQVVQVFLITTLTSAASGAITEIIKNPLGAKDLLAKSLPSASDFYLSYILIQCVLSGCKDLLQIWPFLRHVVLAKITDNPRSRYKAWRELTTPGWGGIFPVYSNMGVIALSYSCISPLVLLFAAGGLWFIQIVWKYKLLYILDSTHDSKGLFYPQALLHLIVGLYLAEICMIGLFALNSSFPPVVLMLIFLLFTLLVHMSISDAIAPLLVSLPQTMKIEEEIQIEEKQKAVAAATAAEAASEAPTGAASSYYDEAQSFGEERIESEEEEGEEEEEEEGEEHVVTGTRAMEGASSVRSTAVEWFKGSTKKKIKTEFESPFLKHWLGKIGINIGPENADKPNFFQRFLHPEEYEDFIALRKLIPADSLPNQVYAENNKYCNYAPPDMWMPKPSLWIPRDEARVSRQEVAHSRVFTPISDRGAVLDKDGRVVVYFDQAPCHESNLLL